MDRFPLFEFQANALKAIRENIAVPPDAGLLALPTGAGKTKVAVWWALQDHVTKGESILWIASRDELLNQAADVFRNHAALVSNRRKISLSFIRGGDFGSLTCDITIASIQSLYIRGFKNDDFTKEGVDPPYVIIVDEAHHTVAPTYREVLRRLEVKGRLLLGLSATPTRTNESERPGLTNIFNKRVIYQERYVDLMKQGFLAEPRHRVKFLDKEIEFTQSQLQEIEQFRELPQTILKKLAEDHSRNQAIVDEYVRRKEEYRRALVFGCNKDHCRTLKKMFLECGINADMIISGEEGSSGRATRKEILDKLRRKELDVLLNVSIMTEGVDVPSLPTIFLARPTMSETLYMQMIGRASRGPRVNGNAFFYAVDFVDNFSRFKDYLSAQYVLPDLLGVVSWRGQAIEEVVSIEGDIGPQSRKSEIPPSFLSSVESVMPFLSGIRSGEIAATILGWYELPNSDGSRGCLVVFKNDAENARKAVQVFLSRPSSDNSLRLYNQLLFDSLISLEKWSDMVDWIKMNNRAPEFVEFDPKKLDLSQAIAYLTSREMGRARFAIEAVKVWKNYYQSVYPSEIEFLEELDKIAGL